jgi:ribonuclease P protein component
MNCRSGSAVSGIPKGKFPKSAHLLKHADFQRVYKQGKRHFSGNMTVFYLRNTPAIAAAVSAEGVTETAEPGGANATRFGFTVPRALGGAVVRNRIRRRVREAVRRHMVELDGVPALDVVFNPKRTARDAEFAVLSDEVARAFQVIRRSVVSSAKEPAAARQQAR